MSDNIDFTSEDLYKQLTNLQTRYTVQKESLLSEYTQSKAKMQQMLEDDRLNPILREIVEKISIIDIDKPLSEDDLKYLQESQQSINDVQVKIEKALIDTKSELDKLLGNQ